MGSTLAPRLADNGFEVGMAKQINVNAAQLQYQEGLKRLQTEGLDLNTIDSLLLDRGIEAILSDNIAVNTYFRNASNAHQDLLYRFDKENPPKLWASPPPGPTAYKNYFYQNDTSQMTHGVHWVHPEILFNPDRAQTEGYYSKNMATAMKNLMDPEKIREAMNFEVNRVQAQGATGGKALARAPGTKSYGTAPGTKDYELPGAPPGGGSGGFGGVPPMGGMPGPGGYPNLENVDWVANERAYFGTMSPDNPMSGWLNMLLEPVGNARSSIAHDAMTLDQLEQQSHYYTGLMANIDPTSPEGQRDMAVLNRQIGELSENRRMLMDKIGQAVKNQNDMMTFVKSIMDITYQTLRGISQNWR